MKMERAGGFPRQKHRVARFTPLAMALAASLVTSTTAVAADIDYHVGASLLYSDNINLSELAPDSETVFAPGFGFDVTHGGTAVEIKALGEFQYLDYQGDTYESEPRGEFAGQLNWHMLPNRLDFLIQDNLSQEPIDITSGATPTNRQEVNVFRMGPSLFLRFGDSMHAQIDARYTNTYAEETKDFNGDRFNLAAHLFRPLDSLSSLSFNLMGTQVNYDDTLLNADYYRDDLYFGYQRESNRLNMDLIGGYTRIDPDNGTPTVDGPLFRGIAGWQMSARSTLDFRLAYLFSDTALDQVLYNTDADGPVIPSIDTLTSLVGASVYKLRRAEIGYGYVGERLNMDLRPFYEHISYPDQNITDSDWDGHGIDINGRYALQPTLELIFSASYATRDYTTIDRVDDDVLASVGLNKQFSTHWTATAVYQRRNRDSNIFGQGYKENLVAFSVTYRNLAGMYRRRDGSRL